VAVADPAQGVEPSFFSLRSMVDLVPLTLAPLQIPDDGGEQRRRVLLRAQWRAAAWPVRCGSTAGRRQPAATARIHGGAAPTRRDGTDPRRGGPNPPRRRGSTAGRRLPPTQSTAAQIRWAWRPPRPFLSLRRCGGLELRRIQSTAVDRRRRRDLGSVRPGSKPVWAFFFFLFFLNDLPRRAFLCGRRGKSNNRGGRSYVAAAVNRITAAGKAVRRGKPRFTVAFRRRRTGLPAAENAKRPTRINIL